MHSLRGRNWWLAGGLIGIARSAILPTPAVTPAPSVTEVDIRLLEKRQDPDAVSLAQVLLTALPLSLRLIAATNVPAVSSILWEEFLDDKRPQWFQDLPWDIQSYLIREFGPETALPPTAPPTTETWNDAETTTDPSWPTETSAWQPSEAMPSSATETSVPFESSGSALSDAISTPTASFTDPSSRASTTLSRTSRASTLSTSSQTADPNAPPAGNAGLSKTQKVGIGVGVPFGLLAVAAVAFGCCFLMRRRRKKHIEGSQPPSSPGFIPRFSFQDRALSSEHLEHRAPLNRGFNHSNQDLGGMNWEDDGYDPGEMAMGAPSRAHTFPPTAPAMAMHDPTPVMAPALFHTHSSNRARGKRTSYTSLHSVAEVSEPDEYTMESPILGRHQTPPKPKPRRPSLPSVLEMPPVPVAAAIKRKPVPGSPTPTSPAAEAASRSLLRPTLTIPETNGSSSSGLVLSDVSTNSGGDRGYQTNASSPISPISNHATKNPFAGGYDYLEDYGPEFSPDGYLDLEDGLYGGNRSLDRYPDPSPPPRKNSRTEWPLRNVIGSGHRRTRSPMWDRVYER